MPLNLQDFKTAKPTGAGSKLDLSSFKTEEQKPKPIREQWQDASDQLNRDSEELSQKVGSYTGITDVVSDIPAIQKFANTKYGKTVGGGVDVLFDGDISAGDKFGAVFSGFGGFAKGLAYSVEDAATNSIPKAVSTMAEMWADSNKNNNTHFDRFSEDMRRGLKEDDPEKYFKLYGDTPVVAPIIEGGTPDKVIEWANGVQKGLEIMQKEKDAKRGFSSEDSFVNPENFGHGLGTGLVSVAEYAGVTYLTKSPAVAAATLGWLESEATYDEAKDKIREDNPEMEEAEIVQKATNLTLLQGAGTAVLEKFGMDALFKGYASRRIGAITSKFITEGTQEGLQTVWQNSVKKFGFDESQSLFEGVVEAIVFGGFVGALGGSVTPTGTKRREEIVDELLEKKPELGRDDAEEIVDNLTAEVDAEAAEFEGVVQDVENTKPFDDILKDLETKSPQQVIVELSATVPVEEAKQIVEIAQQIGSEDRASSSDLPSADDLLNSSPVALNDSLNKLEESSKETTDTLRSDIERLQADVKSAPKNSQAKIGKKKELQKSRAELKKAEQTYAEQLNAGGIEGRRAIEGVIAQQQQLSQSERRAVTDRVLSKVFSGRPINVPISEVIKNEVGKYKSARTSSPADIKKAIATVTPSKDEGRNKALTDAVIETLQNEKAEALIADLSLEEIVEQVARAEGNFQEENVTRGTNGKAKFKNIHDEDLMKIIAFNDAVRSGTTLGDQAVIAAHRLAERYNINPDASDTQIALAFERLIEKNKMGDKVEKLTQEMVEVVTKKKEAKAKKPVTKKKAKKPAISAAQAAQIKDIKLFRHVPIKMVKEITTGAGRKAFGRFYMGMVEFVENSDITTIPHEAFHAYSQMVLSAAERKTMYEEARKAYGRDHATDFDLEETLAQDFAVWYVNKKAPKTFSEKLIALFKKMASRLTEMVTGDTRKTMDAVFADVLSDRAAGKMKTAIASQITPQSMHDIRQAYFQDPEGFTLRLFGHDIFNKVSIGYQETKQAIKSMGLKKGEALIHDLVLEMPQFKDVKKFDSAEYKRTVKSEMIQFTLVESGTYADYGVSNIDHGGQIDDSVTYILNTNFKHGKTGHFDTDSADGLHSHFRAGLNHSDGSFKFLEMQSDTFQKGGAEVTKQQFINKKLSDFNALYKMFNRRLRTLDEIPDSSPASLSDSVFHFATEIKKFGFNTEKIDKYASVKGSERHIKNVADFEKFLSIASDLVGSQQVQLAHAPLTDKEAQEVKLSDQFNTMKNNWFELNLRTGIREAAAKGMTYFDMADSRTLAHIEQYVGEEGGSQVEDANAQTSIGDNVTYLGENEAIVVDTDHNDGEISIIYSEGENLHSYRVDDYIDGEKEYWEGEGFQDNNGTMPYGELAGANQYTTSNGLTIPQLKEVLMVGLQHRTYGTHDKDLIVMEREIEALSDDHIRRNFEDLAYDTYSIDYNALMEDDSLSKEIVAEMEDVKEQIVERNINEFDISDHLWGIYGENGFHTWTDEHGTDYAADAAGENIHSVETLSYRSGTAEDFDMENLTEAQQRITAKYGVNEVDGKERSGEYYKYLKKLRPDLELHTDDSGFTWWRTEITKDDALDVPLYQTETPEGGIDNKLVYHGTHADFTIFEKGDLGFHFGTAEQANARLDTIEKGGETGTRKVMERYISIKNPVTINDPANSFASSLISDLLTRRIITIPEAEVIEAKHNFDTENIEEEFGAGAEFDRVFKKGNDGAHADLRALLQSKGYDGAVYENTIEGVGTSYIVFDASQISEKNEPLFQLLPEDPQEGSIYRDLSNKLEEISEFIEATMRMGEMSYVTDTDGRTSRATSYPDWMPQGEGLRSQTLITSTLKKIEEGGRMGVKQQQLADLIAERTLQMLPTHLADAKILNDYFIEQQKVADAERMEAIAIAMGIFKQLDKSPSILAKKHVKKAIRYTTGQIDPSSKEFSRKMKQRAVYFNRGYKSGYKQGVKDKLYNMLAKSRHTRTRKSKIEKVRSLYRRTKQATRTGGLLPLEYQNRLMDLFADFDMTKMNKSTQKKLADMAVYFASNEGEITADIAKQLERISKFSIGEMTDEQLTEFVTEVNRIFENGVYKKKLMDRAGTKEFDSKIDQLIDGAVNLDSKKNRGIMKGVSDALFDPMRYLDMIDGAKKYFGANVQLIAEPARIAIDNAQMQTDGIMTDALERLGAVQDSFSQEEKARITYFSALEQGGTSQAEALAEYYTKEEGYNFTEPITPAEQEALDIMVETMADIRPQVAAVFEAQKNMPFPKNDRYLSFRYDGDLNVFDLQDTAFDFTVTKTSQGFTMKRDAHVNKILDIEIFETFGLNVSKQIYYGNVQPQLSFIEDVVKDKRYNKAVGSRAIDYLQTFQADIATRGTRTKGALPQGLDALRGNISVAILGYKLSTVAIQPTALMDAKINLDEEFGAKEAWSVWFDFTNLVFNRGAMLAAMEASTSLKVRKGGQLEISELREAQQGTFKNENKFRHGYQLFKKYAFTGIQSTDMRAAGAVFNRAKKAYMKHKGFTEEEATYAAERLMALSQASSNVVNRPQVLNNSYSRFMLPFQTFVVNAFNNTRYDMISTQIKRRGAVKGTIRAIWLSQYLLMAVALEQTIRDTVSKTLFGWEDDEDETFLNKMWGGLIGRIPAASFWFGFDGEFKGKLDLQSNPAVKAVSDLAKAVNETFKWDLSLKEAYGAVKAAGLLLGVPATQQTHQIITSPDLFGTGIAIGRNLEISYDDRKNTEKRFDEAEKIIEKGEEITEEDVEAMAKSVYGSDYKDGDIGYRTNKKAEVIKELAIRQEFGFEDDFVNINMDKENNNEVKHYFATNEVDLSKYRPPVKLFGVENNLMSSTLYKELRHIANASPEDKVRIAALANAETDEERNAVIDGDKNFAKLAFAKYKIIQKAYYESVRAK